MHSKKSQWLGWLALGAGVGLGAAWIARQRRQQPGALPTWRRQLAREYGAARAQQLSGAVRQQFTALLGEQPLPADPALRWHLTENILPGLALYRALLQEHQGDRPAALAEIDALFRTWTLNKKRLLLAPLKFVPDPFRLFKLAFNQQMKIFPAEGWDFQFTENSDQRIAFNATRCFYLKTLTAYGAPELTPAFCKTDEVMAELFPPGVHFVRTKTLGRGDELCDFQYCRG